MNKTFIIFVIVIMTMLGALGGFFFKRTSSGAGKDADGADSAGISSSIKSTLLNKNLYIGGFIYVASALLNVWVLKFKFMPYSVVMPMTAITYIWTLILSRVVLKEKITVKKMAGIAFIIIGAVLICLS